MKELMEGFRSVRPGSSRVEDRRGPRLPGRGGRDLYQYAEAEKPLTGDVVMLDLAEEATQWPSAHPARSRR